MLTLPDTPPANPATNRSATPPTSPDSPAPGWPGHDLLTDPTTASVLHAVWSGDPAVVVPSPPGAGKTRLVALLAAALAHRADLRVGIAAQTRQQAAELANRVGTHSDRARLLWPRKHPRPDTTVTIATGREIGYPDSGGGILIATTARWLVSDPTQLGCDVLLIDEAYQATYADLGALGAFSAQIVCVGDPGQIAPVVTGTTHRWAGSPTGPHQPAPYALIAQHDQAIAEIPLTHTWRLGPATTALIQPHLYPHLPFTSRRGAEHLTATGHTLPELTHTLVSAKHGPTDPALLDACEATARTLLTDTTYTTSTARELTADDLAIVTAHVNQAAALRAALADQPDLLIGTANQLQGLERPAVITLHPLAGYHQSSDFATDPGRTCVMLSRHRTHLHVITDDTSTDRLLTDPATATSTSANLMRTLLTPPAP